MDFNTDSELLFKNDINMYLYNYDIDYHKTENYSLDECLNYNNIFTNQEINNTPLSMIYNSNNNEKIQTIHSVNVKNNINTVPFKKLKFPNKSRLINNFELHCAENYKKEKEYHEEKQLIPQNNLIDKKNKKICYISGCKSKLYKDVLCKYHYNYHNNSLCEIPNCRNMVKKNKLCYKHCRPLCVFKNCKNNCLINSTYCKIHYEEKNIIQECDYNNINSIIDDLNVYFSTNNCESIISDYDILQNNYKTYII